MRVAELNPFSVTVMLTAWSKFRRTLRAFARARGGNVATIFAISAIPILGMVGAAIDFSNANSVQTDLQSALDSVALMLSKEATTDTSQQLQDNAAKYFNALFNHASANNLTITANYSADGGASVVVNGSASVPTTFLSILGYNSLTVSGSSTTKWGSTRLRVALVLDNTGSMNDNGKIGALKTATKNLLTQLKNAATTADDVYVSIIPFVKDVNVGTGNANASWIDWSLTIPSGSTPSSSVGPGSSCPYSNYGNNGYTCVTQPGGSTTTNTIPSSGSNKGYICPSNSIGCYDSVAQTTTSTKVVSSGWGASCGYYSNCSCSGYGSSKVCTQTTTSTTYTHTWFVDPTKWGGCVTDRGSNSAPGSNAGYDQEVTEPTTSIPETLFPAEQYSACPQAMMGLSYNWTGMNTLVDNMVANGSTNQPIGLVWGWQSLVGGGPFTVPTMDSNYKYSQIIILLTDGLNTQDRWYGDGRNTSQAVDNRMYQNGNGSGTCANIKNAGITIYTIQVNTGGDPTSTLLQNCASDSSKFFLLTSADQIVTTFQTIGTNLTKLRLAK
jgi:Flp pilus assembly protein TadG